MSQTQELPDRSIGSHLDAQASGSIPFELGTHSLNQDDTTPALPPQLQSVRSHTADEIVGIMNRTPLFMTSLDEAGNEDGENIELEAMRALQYEGTPAENAQGFKEQGNEMAKAKRWKDGQEFYTKGIAVLSQKKPRENESEVEDEAELRKELSLEEACYVNRALCNLELKNYRSTTLDCAHALRLNPRNVKAHYRSSMALLALDKILEASDSCNRGLDLDPTNTSLKALVTEIKIREDHLVIIQRKKQQEDERAKKEKAVLVTALRARNINIQSTAQPPEMEDAAIRLDPDPFSPTSALIFPVVLLYPLHAQSDFIKAFSENDTIPQHLDYIFPLPWDRKHEYTIDTIDCYMGTERGGLVKVGKKVNLGKVLGSDGIVILDSIVRIHVILKSRPNMWIEEMKVRKGK